MSYTFSSFNDLNTNNWFFPDVSGSYICLFRNRKKWRVILQVGSSQPVNEDGITALELLQNAELWLATDHLWIRYPWTRCCMVSSTCKNSALPNIGEPKHNKPIQIGRDCVLMHPVHLNEFHTILPTWQSPLSCNKYIQSTIVTE